MRTYDPREPILGIHIPRCAGTSLGAVIQGWFGGKFLGHYPLNKGALPPPKHRLEPGSGGICIYGHFNGQRGFGVDDYYPEVGQLFTFLRDPLEIAYSTYFYWKKKRRAIRIQTGRLEPGSYYDYRSFEDYFTKRPRSSLLKYMPSALGEDNYRQVLEERFVYIGIVEEMQPSVDALASVLGFPKVAVDRRNVAERNEEIPESEARSFRERNRLAYDIYEFARERYRDPLA